MATVIENNLIYDQTTTGLLVSNAETLIRNNVILNAGRAGIWIFEESASCPFLASYGVSIVHNTLIDHFSGIRLSRSSQCLGAAGTTVTDNLLAGFTNGEMRGLAVWPYHGFPDYLEPDGSETTFAHNLIFGAGFEEPIRVINCYYDVDSAPLAGTGNLQQEPFFIDQAQGDYRLTEKSPGKDAASDGEDMGVTTNGIGEAYQSIWKYWGQPLQLPFAVDYQVNRRIDVVELAAFVGH